MPIQLAPARQLPPLALRLALRGIVHLCLLARRWLRTHLGLRRLSSSIGSGLVAAVFALSASPLVLAERLSAAVLTLVADPFVLADRTAAAVFAPVTPLSVLADALATAILATVFERPVLTYRATTTFLANAASSIVNADGAPVALLAKAASIPVLTNTCSPTFFACVALPAMLTNMPTTARNAFVAFPPVLADAVAAVFAPPPYLAVDARQNAVACEIDDVQEARVHLHGEWDARGSGPLLSPPNRAVRVISLASEDGNQGCADLL